MIATAEFYVRREGDAGGYFAERFLRGHRETGPVRATRAEAWTDADALNDMIKKPAAPSLKTRRFN